MKGCEFEGCTLPASWLVVARNVDPMYACETHTVDVITEARTARVSIALAPFNQEPEQAT